MIRNLPVLLMVAGLSGIAAGCLMLWGLGATLLVLGALVTAAGLLMET